MKNFKSLRIWQKGLEIAVKSYRLTSQFPSQEKFSIVSQINRAGISIPSNIAEGSSRKVKKIIPVLLKYRWALHLNWRPNC